MGVLAVLIVISFGAIVVKAATRDTAPPTLKSISLKESNKTYSVGDKVYLNIDANDDVSGISNIILNIVAVEWDKDTTGSCSGSEYVYDIEDNPYFSIPTCAGNGKYKIDYVTLEDNAGNSISYTNDINDKGTKYFSFNLNYTVKTDRSTKIPTLKSITLDKSSYKKDDYVNMKVSFDGDSSNVDSIDVWFSNKEKNQDFVVSSFRNDFIYNEENNTYEANIEAPLFNGNYSLQFVMIVDKVGNDNYYTINKNDTKEVDSESNWYYVEPIKFTVSNGFDTVPEVKISKIDYTYRKLVAPNVFKIVLNLEDSANAIYNAKLSIALKKDANKNSNWSNDKYIEAYLYKDKNGNLTGYADIDQFNDIGVYYLADISFNYSYSGRNSVVDSKNIKFDKVDLFEIIEDTSFDVITSTTDKELVEKIKKAKDDAKIAINSTSSPVVTKDVFDAIKDTNKTIYIETGGIQWVFNGNDIEITKDIDTSVIINYLYNDDINENLKDIVNKGLVINFKKNGKLPGKALIRVKTDYALRDYIGIENLHVYHYKRKDGKIFDGVANNVSMTEDGYLEFYINHNSTFVISSNEVDSKYVSDSVSELALNDNSVISNNSNDSNNNVIIISVICVVIVLLIVLLLIVKRKKKKKNNKVAKKNDND